MSEITEKTAETPAELPHPIGADVSYMIMNVKYETMEEAIGILKNNAEQTKQDWLDFFEPYLKTEEGNPLIPYWEPQYRPFILFFTEEELMAKIDSIPAMSVSEIFIKYQNNAEQLMRALAYLDPEEIVKAVDGKLLNEETLTKTQQRTIVKKEYSKNDVSKPLPEDAFEVQDVTYEDTYKLYEIEGSKLGLDENAYAVKCDCTSTGKNYYLFVEKEFATSAVDAIASTIRDDKGNRLTRDQYLLIESES